MRVLIYILVLTITGLSGYTQTEYKEVRRGNNLYEDGKYKDAEISYRKAIEKSPSSVKGSFNLGNSLYKQDNFEEAGKNFMNTIGKISPDDKQQQSAAYHNLGNAMVKSENYKEAIEAYKQALRLNPSDNDTRYNLSYAMNRQQQQQQNQQSQDQDDNQDNKDDENVQEQQSESGDNQQEDDRKEQQQNPQISKKDAERMLQALNNDEQKTLDKVNKQKVRARPVQMEKDW